MRRGHEDYLTQALEEDQENRDPNSISVRGSGGGVGIGEDMSTMEQVACDDLKAFERRLTEIISSAQPSAMRWRIVLLIASVCVAIGAVYWLGDPKTAEVSFQASLYNHPFFTLSSIATLLLFLAGVHRRIVSPSIFVSRGREVLADLSMDCDDTGKLILKPRPETA